MSTITLEEAQAALKEIVQRLKPGRNSSSPKISGRWRNWSPAQWNRRSRPAPAPACARG